MAVMVPKGLAAAVLASIPLQRGVVGGELIMNVVYGVVLSSIVMTSILLILVEKTKLSDFYKWFLSPGIPKLSLETTIISDMIRKSEVQIRKVKPSGTKLFSSGKK